MLCYGPIELTSQHRDYLITFDKMATEAPRDERSDLQAPLSENEKTVSSSNTPTLHEPAQEEIQAKPEVELPAEEDDETQWLTGWKLVSMITSLTLAAFLMLLDMSIISTAIPRITLRLSLSA
ncbi:hypothetical protein NXS19_009307 [Fusarium pseudograminearum]|nr:hypothetical protein NXS19_009307 [Fusarium pseudograminearum]